MKHGEYHISVLFKIICLAFYLWYSNNWRKTFREWNHILCRKYYFPLKLSLKTQRLKLSKVHLSLKINLNSDSSKFSTMGRPVLKKYSTYLPPFFIFFLVYKFWELSSVNEKHYRGTKATKFILSIFYSYNSLPSHREIMIFDWPICLSTS